MDVWASRLRLVLFKVLLMVTLGIEEATAISSIDCVRYEGVFLLLVPVVQAMHDIGETRCRGGVKVGWMEFVVAT
jgi:hypothetical protein